GSKMVVYVGHDTNLANIGGMLGLHWDLNAYRRDETPPAGALAFELLRQAESGRYFVRLVYVSQTLRQMRRMTRLSATNPPARSEVALPGCNDKSDGGACAWADFEARVKEALDLDCAETESR